MSFQLMDDSLSAFGENVSTEFFETLANNINYLYDSVPVGMIIPVLDGVNGCPVPNSNIWVLCNGSTISNADSPLNGQTTPNLMSGSASVWLKISESGRVGLFSGQNGESGDTRDVIPLDHNHGNTGGITYNNVFTTETGVTNGGVAGAGPNLAVNDHTHSISNYVSTDAGPLHCRINFYMKVM